MTRAVYNNTPDYMSPNANAKPKYDYKFGFILVERSYPFYDAGIRLFVSPGCCKHFKA